MDHQDEQTKIPLHNNGNQNLDENGIEFSDLSAAMNREDILTKAKSVPI